MRRRIAFFILALFVILGIIFYVYKKPAPQLQVAHEVEHIKHDDSHTNESHKHCPSTGCAVVNTCVCYDMIIPDIVKQAKKGVVTINTVQKEKMEIIFPPSPFGDFFDKFFEGQKPKTRRVEGQGSGFLVKSEQGEPLLITNAHVVNKSIKLTIYFEEKTTPVVIDLSDGNKDGIILSDAKSDIAVIRLGKIPQDTTFLKWGDTTNLMAGEKVLAIGNPFGIGMTVSDGIISSTKRDIPSQNPQRYGFLPDLIQHTASLNVGNSGGCLIGIFNENGQYEGRVIGINTVIFSPTGGHIGIGFAIPAHAAERIVKQLLKHGKAIYGWLGVRVRELDDDLKKVYGVKDKAFRVYEVYKNSPAEKAGLKADDIIVRYKGNKIAEDHKLDRLVEETVVGSKVALTVLRKGKEVELSVTIEERNFKKETDEKPESKSKGEVIEGLTVMDIEKDQADLEDTKGIIVVDVEEKLKDKMNELQNIQSGDILVKVETKNQGIDIESVEDFKKAIKMAKAEKAMVIALKFFRRGPRGEMVSYLYPLQLS